jgi:6-phosphogluconolactonase
MRTFKAVIAALSLVSVSLISVESVSAATYVYVSNADDGNIGLYTLERDGTLKPGDKFDAGGKPVMPMGGIPLPRSATASTARAAS